MMLESNFFLTYVLALINSWGCRADANINSLRLRSHELIFQSALQHNVLVRMVHGKDFLFLNTHFIFAVMILSFETDRPGQTM